MGPGIGSGSSPIGGVNIGLSGIPICTFAVGSLGVWPGIGVGSSPIGGDFSGSSGLYTGLFYVGTAPTPGTLGSVSFVIFGGGVVTLQQPPHPLNWQARTHWQGFR